MDGEWLEGWMESLRKKEQHVVKNSPNEGQAQFTSVTADNVPMDWIVGKTEEGEQRIVGPDGSRHKTRREALKHMVSKACPEEEIALMRSISRRRAGRTMRICHRTGNTKLKRINMGLGIIS